MPSLTIKPSSARQPSPDRRPSPARQHSRSRTATRWAVGLGASAALAACSAAPTANAASETAVTTGPTLTYYAFDVNGGSADPGLIPAPGTGPGDFAQGDVLLINDQVTVTHKVNGGYPIVGRDAGACTLTRIPAKAADPALASCVVTVVVPGGSLAVQGIVAFKARQPQPAVLAVTGGTGQFAAAAGTVSVAFTTDYKALTFRLR